MSQIRDSWGASGALRPVVLGVWAVLGAAPAWAEVVAPASAASAASAPSPAGTPEAPRPLARVLIQASADASKGGLTRSFAGGQVARGGRVGLLGNQDVMNTPFNTTSYTSELIQNTQAHSVGDVLLNDPGIRVARGFGNFQESYFIRGFILNSDSVAYNGLYGLLPRQYISAELFERVEVLRGASAFLNGATPNSDAIGGSINLLPKRAPVQAIQQLTVGTASGGQTVLAVDVARRFGPDQSTGVRINVASRAGDTAVDRESVNLGMGSIGLDWRGRDLRLSADVGYQDHKLKRTRTNVTLGATVTAVPKAPDSAANWAQPWSYSNERDWFGTLRGEMDLDRWLGQGWTAWWAVGARSSDEANSLANLTLTNGATGAGTTSRFDNTREDRVRTGEVGLRGLIQTGPVRHELTAALNVLRIDKRAAYGVSTTSANPRLIATGLYDQGTAPLPVLISVNNRLEDPATTGMSRLRSTAIADTLVMLDKRLRLTVGVRHQFLDLRTYAYNTGAPAAPYDRSRTSPMGGVLFKWSPSVSAYANYIEALTQGETAPSTATAAIGKMLDPYVSRQKELGFKFERDRLGGALAFFTTDKPRGVVTDTKDFVAQGQDRHQGVELTAFGEPVPHLKLLGGLTWLDARQDSTGSATTDGKRVIGVPRHMLNLGAEWEIPGLQGVSMDARIIATSGVYANATNTLAVPGWSRLDLGARYQFEAAGHLVTLRARVDNVADRRYWASSGGYPGSGYLVLGTPRSFSLNASLDY
ncbi:TonB-dependent receptor [Roseateles sp. SL47]|uniref:TonB-dependent receptor n=1 Tax=Roseateles sp. SL47 TaxID=2995138 RepID=UPI00226EF106|nr:TonB-dependent receptor [Roseateles sp. SL47]WAC74796.1 TonB-dependent receptor [Roseateles sp. SL47]